jgi:hypothetical protein
MSDVAAPMWASRAGEVLSLREVSARITKYFWPSIARLGDSRSLRLIQGVMHGTMPSLLELEDRPAAYESVGRLCTWTNLFPVRALPRSGYERVFIRAISRRKLRLERDVYTPVGMRGWSHVVFARDRDHTRHAFSLDFLLKHIDDWVVGPKTERHIRETLRERLERR